MASIRSFTTRPRAGRERPCAVYGGGEEYDEAVLLNRDGEVRERTYTNLLVRQGEDLCTPPVESGLLVGMYRDHVLKTQPQASTVTLSLDDLMRADGFYCCNVLREWCEAELILRDRSFT